MEEAVRNFTGETTVKGKKGWRFIDQQVLAGLL